MLTAFKNFLIACLHLSRGPSAHDFLVHPSSFQPPNAKSAGNVTVSCISLLSFLTLVNTVQAFLSIQFRLMAWNFQVGVSGRLNPKESPFFGYPRVFLCVNGDLWVFSLLAYSWTSFVLKQTNRQKSVYCSIFFQPFQHAPPPRGPPSLHTRRRRAGEPSHTKQTAHLFAKIKC